MNVLSLQHRPVIFGDVVGQDHVTLILRAMITTQKIPPAMVFSGTRGTGKTTCARIFAAALNCENPSQNSSRGDACGTCPQCRAVQEQTSHSLIEIDAASNGGVDEVRRIKDLVLYGHDAQWRTVILDEAHSMSNAAYHALLKLLEEPPPNTNFILVTTEPDKILGTVRSRSMPFEFRRIKTSDVENRLRAIAASENIDAEDSLFSEIAKRAQGGLRDALMLFDQVSLVGVTTGEGFREFFGIADYSLPLMWSALRGDHAEGHRLIAENFSRTGEASAMVADLSRLVSELLVIKSEGRPPRHTEQALAERVEMAHAVSAEALVRAIEILWDLRTRTRASENDQHSSMEMAFSLIARVLQPAVPHSDHPRDQARTQPRTPILPANQSREKLTLAEIDQLTTGR